MSRFWRMCVVMLTLLLTTLSICLVYLRQGPWSFKIPMETVSAKRGIDEGNDMRISKISMASSNISISKKSKERCSFELFKKAASIQPDGVVDGRGTWSRDMTGTIERYNPVICQLSHGKQIPKAKLRACFTNYSKLRHIAIVGDSNGRRYTLALHAILKSVMSCSKIYEHERLTYGSYTSPSVVVKRRCRCESFCRPTVGTTERNRHLKQSECSIVNAGKQKLGQKIMIEYVPLFFWGMSDPSLVSYCTRPTNCMH